MHQSADGQSCPGCEEPVESGDRFCGACGYDLSASSIAQSSATVTGGCNGRTALPARRAMRWVRA
ncbi:zinc ribbon domain-containing protein, partial [Streptomyces zhihengii]